MVAICGILWLLGWLGWIVIFMVASRKGWFSMARRYVRHLVLTLLKRNALQLALGVLLLGCAGVVHATSIYSINAGGPVSGGSWAADEFAVGGASVGGAGTVDTSGVSSPAPAEVYSTVHYGTSFQYVLPGLTPSSSYTVRLHFCELFHGAAGQRVFDVSANGTSELAAFDIVSAAGGPDKAVVRAFNCMADSSGHITLGFVGEAGVDPYAMVNGIEVIEGGSSGDGVGAECSVVGSTVASQLELNLTFTDLGSATMGAYRVLIRPAAGTTAYVLVHTGSLAGATGITNQVLGASSIGSYGPGSYQVEVQIDLSDGTTAVSHGIVGVTSDSGLGAGDPAGQSSFPDGSGGGSPGDLKIGIPHIGSISIPAGWLIQVISYANTLSNIASGLTAMTLKSAFGALTSELGLTGAQLDATFRATEAALFVPRSDSLTGFQNKLNQFINWGPTSYAQGLYTEVNGVHVTSTTVTPLPPSTDPMSHLSTLEAHTAERSAHVRPMSVERPHNDPVGGDVPTLGVGGGDGSGSSDGFIGIPVMDFNPTTGVWGRTGDSVPFDFSRMTSSGTWLVFRIALGAMVYLTFGWVIMVKMIPKQVL